MADNKLISIVIPTHNRPAQLVEALDSVAQQQYRPLELIIVDDGSDARTREAVQAWSKNNRGEHFDVHYFPQDQHGPAVARNRGLLESRGDYIQFLDDDHLLAPEALEHLVAALPEPEAVAVSVASHQNVAAEDADRTTSERLAPPSYDTRKTLLEKLVDGRWFVPTSGYLFTRAAMTKVGEWNPKIRFQGGDELMIRAAVQAVGFIAAPKAMVYQREASGPRDTETLRRRVRDNITARERAARDLTLRGAIQSYQPAFGDWYRSLSQRYGEALERELADKPCALVKWATR